MKRIFTLLVFVVTLTAYAQSPQGFNYQATVRNSVGQLLLNQTVLVKFSILQNSDTGTVVYSENQTAITDDLGHINLVVGQGAPNIGAFSAINWSNGTYYLGIELNTGSGYVSMGITQLISVPYALHANTATSTTAINGGFTHFIGESYGGGIIFHLWKDNQGQEHGLIIDKTDLIANQIVWSNIDLQIGDSAQSSWDGLNNSIAITSQAGHINSAAKLCLDSTNGGQSDWYLPSIQELNILWNNYFTVAMSISQISGASILQKNMYWSSSEGMNSSAWTFSFRHGNNEDNFFDNRYKTDIAFVRAVKRF